MNNQTPFVLRVDDFPAWTETMDEFVPGSDFMAFHEVLARNRIPYLIAVTPQPCLRPLDRHEKRTRQLTEAEQQILRDVAAGGAASLALHGITHRTRSDRTHAEFIGLDDDFFEEQIRYGQLELKRMTGILARVFVPPFNRIEPGQLDILSKRFGIVCGGPESVPLLGHRGVERLANGSIYLPCYPPYYGRAHEILKALELQPSADLQCLTLHWEWERRRGYGELESFCIALRNHVQSWDSLL
jgi:peptidoglycan/xylan/chitin deacetylase (PgdA/CDA1 family)